MTPQHNLLLRFIVLRKPGIVSETVTGLHHVRQVTNVSDGQSKRVHFRQPAVVIHSGRNAHSEVFEGVVDGFHAPTFSHVGRFSLLDFFHGRV